jgi:ring-1,2-phenylacetyl-CoA epoxidase subunit PaaE
VFVKSVTEPTRFHKLIVKDVRRETADSVSVAFEIPQDLKGAFAYQHGQYLTVEVNVDGDKLRRAYSIVSGLDDNEMRIGVKKTNGGLVSSYINDNLKTGDRIDVMPPLGRFTVPLDASLSRNFLFIAAGSGITPILSILRTVLSREPKSNAMLVFGNRRQADIMFLETIEEMKNLYLERLSLYHVLSREWGDIEVLNGHIDVERMHLILQYTMPPSQIDHVFLCGPGTLLDDLESGLQKLGVASDKIHREVFTPAEGKHGTPIIVGTGKHTEGETRIELILDGRRHFFSMQKDESIIDAARRSGIEAPFSCKGGMCCTCRAKIVEGAVEMETNYSLEKWELEAGFVLTCQSHPKTEKIVVDYDAR